MTIGLVLGFLSAVVYGCADFCGGKATRLVPASTVTFRSQIAGLGVLAVGVALVPGAGPTWRAIGFGALGGLGGALGILLLYHGLAVGTMSIVSPVTAVTAAAIPVLFGRFVLNDRPPTAAYVGIACALAAIGLVGLSGPGPVSGGGVRIAAIAVGAGCGFGLFFVLLARAGDPREVGLWALVGARPVSIAVAGLVAKRQGAPLLPPRSSRRLIRVTGVLDQFANLLYVLAVGRALLSILAVLASLYPVSTVALARIVDRERLRPVQLAGLALACVGLVLIVS